MQGKASGDSALFKQARRVDSDYCQYRQEHCRLAEKVIHAGVEALIDSPP